jgi:large subunit ribosomal protein L35
MVIFGPKRSWCAKSAQENQTIDEEELEEIMPKLKTHKGAAKRVRLTATGKIKRGHSHARHMLTSKTTKRKRNLDLDTLVSDSDQARVEAMLPYGRK